MNDNAPAHKPSQAYPFQAFLLLFLCFVAHPLYASNQQKIDFYLPIQTKNEQFIEELTSALNTAGLNNINVKNSTQWQTYQQSVRHGHEGIYLSPPHFTAWLKHKHNFKPVLKLKGTLSYVIISDTNNTDIFEIRDLVNRKTCAQAPLNLDYLLITQAFAKSVQNTETHIVNLMRDELNNTKSPCSAFSISEHQFNNLEITQPGHYTRLTQGPRYSNYAISISPSLDEKNLIQFKKFLKLPSTQSTIKPLLNDISSDPIFTDTNIDDYPVKDADTLEKYWSK